MSDPQGSEFSIEVYGNFVLSVAEIWPDGDAPEDPTVEDVLSVMKQSRTVHRLLNDWSLIPLAVGVRLLGDPRQGWWRA